YLIKDGKKFTETQVIDILKSLLHTLDYIHSLNPAVIHRDIQPKNIIYHPSGKIYLVDFGGVGQIIKETLYEGNTFIGTFGYFPQEQMLGKAYPSSDLYSLGMTTIFLLTAKDPANLDFKQGKCNYTPFVQLSAHFKNILDKMIESWWENRFENAKLVLEQFEERTNPTIKYDDNHNVNNDDNKTFLDKDNIISEKEFYFSQPLKFSPSFYLTSILVIILMFITLFPHLIKNSLSSGFDYIFPSIFVIFILGIIVRLINFLGKSRKLILTIESISVFKNDQTLLNIFPIKNIENIDLVIDKDNKVEIIKS
ncbi:MAG: protein kinase, partial [Okeania sp. SIO3B3]|nr:protein kinase [Okeania sp. SIO3B3]